jgi:hypothetical protein
MLLTQFPNQDDRIEGRPARTLEERGLWMVSARKLDGSDLTEIARSSDATSAVERFSWFPSAYACNLSVNMPS